MPLRTLDLLDTIDKLTSQIESIDTPEDVYVCISLIEQLKADPETARSFESELHQKILALIASGLDYASCKIMAEVALKTRDVDFPRWHI